MYSNNRVQVFLAVLSYLFVFVDYGNGQENVDRYQSWAPDHKLEWSDFKGSMDSAKTTQYGTMPSAVSVISISYTFDYLDTTLSGIKVFCVFNKEISWAKDTSSECLLQHEQLHFDIYELYTRKIRKAIEEPMSLGITDESVYKDAINGIKVEAKFRNQNYDKETYSGTIEKEQERWRQMIKCELCKMSKYYRSPGSLNEYLKTNITY